MPKQTTMSRNRRKSAPLDPARLEELALSYLARFATSSAKLEAYLQRKVRERGVDEGVGQLDVAGLVQRMVDLRYVDDEAYAKARSAGLLRKGYGARRVDQALRFAGIGEQTRDEVAPDEHASRNAAFMLARKRGFGPFGEGLDRSDPKKREKQIAAMIRAGHGFDVARSIIDATSIEELECWVEEARECNF